MGKLKHPIISRENIQLFCQTEKEQRKKKFLNVKKKIYRIKYFHNEGKYLYRKIICKYYPHPCWYPAKKINISTVLNP